MTAQHTPGPWWSSRLDVGTAPMMHVKVARASGSNYEEAIANARLIAAAPEMLEALIAVIDEKAPSYHDCTDDGLPECAWCIARAAIAKAKGSAE